MKCALRRTSEPSLTNASHLSGDVSRLRGDASGLRGNVTGLSGDVDECGLMPEERERGVDIVTLVEAGK